MHVFTERELTFLEQAPAPARLAVAHPEHGTPQVLPVEWALNADGSSIDVERTEAWEGARVDPRRVDTAALVIDDVQPSGRSRGIELTGPIEALPEPRLARIRPRRVRTWGIEGPEGARDLGSPREEADHPADEGPAAASSMMAVVRRSAYDPDALTRGRAQMAQFERIHAAQPGYAGNLVVDLGDGERFVVTLWASEEHAAAARTALTPVVREVLDPMERAPSRLLGVGPVVTTDLTLAELPPSGEHDERSRHDRNETSSFQPNPGLVTWRMRFRSPPEAVYRALTTDEGRASFWAERTVERGDRIDFEFPGGMTSQAHVLETEQDRLFRIDYFGAVVAFELEPTRDRGTDLRLLTHGFAPKERTELMAGWLNVLFPLKAFVDHGVDLRNHDPDRTWRHCYADQ